MMFFLRFTAALCDLNDNLMDEWMVLPTGKYPIQPPPPRGVIVERLSGGQLLTVEDEAVIRWLVGSAQTSLAVEHRFTRRVIADEYCVTKNTAGVRSGSSSGGSSA